VRRLLALVTALALAMATSATGCSLIAPRSNTLVLAGKVRAEQVLLGAPALSSSGPAGGAASGGSSSATASATPRLSGRVATVRVGQGDRVHNGQLLATMDRRLLDLQVQQAEVGVRLARAQVGKLRDTDRDLRDKESQLRDKRKTVEDALAKLADTRATLVAQQAKLAATRRTLDAQLSKALAGQRQLTAGLVKLRAAEAQLLAAIAQLEKAAASIPSTAPPVPDDPRIALEQARAQLAGVQDQITQLSAQLAGVTTGIAKLKAGLGKLEAGQAKLTAGLAKLDAGEAKAREGLAKIDEGLNKLADARRKVQRGIRTATAFIPVRERAVGVAKAIRAQAQIVAPFDATVLDIAHPGDTLLVGAPLVTLRPTRLRIDTYVTAAQLRRVPVGTSARVSGDWSSTPLAARVVTVDDEYTFPPTTFPTSETHMTRAFRVTLELDDENARLPAGVPVDVQFGAPAAQRSAAQAAARRLTAQIEAEDR